MTLSIGDNIKSLRRAQNVTQEELSLALGVSCQSVSRWEMGICYPDMELLPCIANYFGVSLDTLCGMEELRSQDTLNAIFTTAGEMRRNGDRAGEIALLRDAVRRYPHNEGLLSELAIALTDVSAIKNGGEGNVRKPFCSRSRFSTATKTQNCTRPPARISVYCICTRDNGRKRCLLRVRFRTSGNRGK